MADYQSLCTYWRDFNSDRPIIKSDDMTLEEELDFILRPCAMKISKTTTHDSEFSYGSYYKNNLYDYYSKQLLDGKLSLSSNIVKIKRDLFTDSGYQIKRRDFPYKNGPDPNLSIYQTKSSPGSYAHPSQNPTSAPRQKQLFCDKFHEKEIEVQFGLNQCNFDTYRRYKMSKEDDSIDNPIDGISSDYIKLLLEYNRYRKYEKMFEEQDARIRKMEEEFKDFKGAFQIRAESLNELKLDNCKYQESKIKILEDNNRLIQELSGMVNAQNIEIQQLKRNQDKRITLKDIEELQFQINELKLLNQIKMTEKTKRGRFLGLFQKKDSSHSY